MSKSKGTFKRDRASKLEAKILAKKREKIHAELIKKDIENRKKEKIAPKDACISLKNINKIYDNHVQAVYDFNLDIKPQEFIVFVGPSGCGKSTTLRMIAGLEDITYGDLFISGEYANDLIPKERDVAMVFQSYALYPNMTVYDNLAFSLKVRHMDKDVIRERVLNAAKILEIEEYLDRKPAALSGGQRQRVALGRAIVRNAKVFLMDEPLSNLDAKLRVQMRSEIVKLHNRIGSTTVYVTHDQTEAMTMADRIVVMKLGYVQQIGTPKEIYNYPSNVFVATFIGAPAMNILDAKYNKGTITLENGYTHKLTKAEAKAYDDFYKVRIEKIKEDITRYETELETRTNELKNPIKLKYDLKIAKLNEKYNDKILKAKAALAKANDAGNQDLITKAEETIKLLEAERDNKIKLLEATLEAALGKEFEKERKTLGRLKDKALAKGQSYEELLADYNKNKDAKLQLALNKDDTILISNNELKKAKELLTRYEELLNKEEREVLFGIRPEDILPLDMAGIIKNPSKPFDIKITIAELLGNEYYLHSDIGGHDMISKASSNTEVKRDETLKVVLNLDHIHLFDTVSKDRII